VISAVAGNTAAGGRSRWEIVTKEVCILVSVSAGRVRAWPCGKMHGLLESLTAPRPSTFRYLNFAACDFVSVELRFVGDCPT
jgi:hypothetical protein